MGTVSNGLMSYASISSYVSVGYGSVAASNLVLKRELLQLDHYLSLGLSSSVAAAMAANDVVSIYGEGWESVDEDGIPI